MEATMVQDPFVIERLSPEDEDVPQTDAVICRLLPPEADDLFDTEI